MATTNRIAQPLHLGMLRTIPLVSTLQCPELWVSRCPTKTGSLFCLKVLRKKFAMDVEEPPAFCPEDWSSCDGSCVGFLAGLQCPVL